MLGWLYLKNPIRYGLVPGLISGVVNLVFSWLFPLNDDTIAALLRFYGPMFFLWGFVPQNRSYFMRHPDVGNTSTPPLIFLTLRTAAILPRLISGGPGA